MSNVSDFFDDEEIKREAELLWAGVFQGTYNVLKTADAFGFDEIEIKSNPNIYELIAVTETLEFWLDKAIARLQDMNDTDHALIRMIFNAKHQVSAMQQMVAGLKTKDRDLYDKALERLRTQAQF